ncbi:hypothetical protein [Pseudonocardia sp.]|uniref:hypothetical protein n=1 Tax=Pseudonocardia sp. TaxID=60912 RepID=UPI003D0A0028
MAVLRIRVKVSSTAKLDRLARRLREAADGGLQSELTKGVVTEAPRALAEVRTSFKGVQITATPSRGGGRSTGLRARVAAATTAEPHMQGARFEVDPQAVDTAYGRTLSWGVDGLGRWRHPTFGRTGKGQWVTQKGQEVFFKTLRGHPGWEPRLERALDKVARRIEG